ncbi:SDR family oxidoreductase [Vibrio vulnificus]|uniref:SDR family oxidoreductase n=1 Tax=Vibrio vulnificus TaxID=672 RepID=UPI0028C0FF2C|nr:SDR family oxidoreductase [Vibrio vulnificus]HDY7471716.1 SDR family oxidoreductase [Vibrio vulnificus]
MQLSQANILLTGATGGIGQATAKTLARLGANLILQGRNEQKLRALKNQLSGAERHHILLADLASEEGIAAVNRFAQQHYENHQRINVLINNAGCNAFAPLSERSAHDLEQEFKLNLLTPMLLSQASLSWLSRPGIILNIGSTFGSIGYPGYSSYCAAKAGLHRFSEALDRELTAEEIRVLYLAPRATSTSLNSEAVVQMNQQLGNRSDDPQVVADHIVLMLEKEIAAKWIGWPEKLFARLNQLLPSVVASAIRKQQHTIEQFINRTSH